MELNKRRRAVKLVVTRPALMLECIIVACKDQEEEGIHILQQKVITIMMFYFKFIYIYIYNLHILQFLLLEPNVYCF